MAGKAFSLTLIALLAMSICAPSTNMVSSSTTPVVYTNPAMIDWSGQPIGGTFTVDVNINSPDIPIWSGQIGIGFNGTKLNCISFAKGSAIDSQWLWVAGTINNTGGYVTYCGWSCTGASGTGWTGTGTFVTFTFQVMDYGSSQLDLTMGTGSPDLFYRTRLFARADLNTVEIATELSDGFFTNPRAPPNGPVAHLWVSHMYAIEDMVVTFDGSASLGGFDGENEVPIDWYCFDFGDGTPVENGSSSIVQHAYTRGGMFYHPTLTVHAPVNRPPVPDTDITSSMIYVMAKHNLAVVDVKPDAPAFYQGYNLNVNVTVLNMGIYNETSNVMLYANTSLLGIYENATLNMGEEVFAFTWNTSEVPFGNYILLAEVSSVSGEWFTDDNTLSCTVQVGPDIHDLAVVGVRTSEDFLYTGENVTISVDTLNLGYFPETFNLTVYADLDPATIGDEIVIETKPESLPIRNFASVDFVWNTTGVGEGNYTISAVANGITCETDLTNNVWIGGKVGVFAPIPCNDVNVTCPATITLNPAIFSFDYSFGARLVGIGNASIVSTGFEGVLRILGSRNGTIHLCVNQPGVEVYTFYLSAYATVDIPLWLMFQPETNHYMEIYNGTYTLQLTVCGTHRRQLNIVGIDIGVCQNGVYVYNGDTVTFTWNLTGGSLVYLEAEPDLPPGWTYTVDPPIGTFFETPQIVSVNITAPPDAGEGEMGRVTLRAYKNATGMLIWQFIYFASTDIGSPSIEAVEAPILTYTGDLSFNATISDKSGIQSAQLYYSVNDGPWDNQTMQWVSGDTFNSTIYTLAIPQVPDNSVVKYYVVATDWFNNQTQSDMQIVTVTYDLAVADVKIDKTSIGQGFGTQVNVSVENQGTVPLESVKVFIYANASLLRTEVIPYLASFSSTTLTFYWNTTGLPKGNYTITASIVPLLYETDTVDNAVTSGMLRVTVVGDFNGDFKVGPADFALLAAAYGSSPYNPKWNPNCDINNDDKVGPADFAQLAAHYGQHYP